MTPDPKGAMVFCAVMRSPGAARPSARECEWLGGRYALPRKLYQHSEEIRPDVVLWLELPSGVLISQTVIGPESPLTFGETLAEAMKDPVDGPARKPGRIRVPEQALADALQGTIGSETTVVVAPVPELDMMFAQVVGDVMLPGYRETYLAEGEISPGVVADLFAAASAYYRADPWRHVKDRQVVRIDIPDLEAEGRGLAIGGPGESFALVLFHSVDYYVAAAEQAFHPSEEEALCEATLPREALAVSLSFNRKKDLPAQMVGEIEAHGWEVAGAKAYPRVTGLGEDVTAQFATEREYQILAACAWALAALFARYPEPFVFERDELKTMCESFTGEGGVPVMITAPHESVLFNVMLDDIRDAANRED